MYKITKRKPTDNTECGKSYVASSPFLQQISDMREKKIKGKVGKVKRFKRQNNQIYRWILFEYYFNHINWKRMF